MNNDKTNIICSFLKQHWILKTTDYISLDKGIYSRNLTMGEVILYDRHEHNHYIFNVVDKSYCYVKPLALNEDEVIKLMANSVVITSEDIEHDNL